MEASILSYSIFVRVERDEAKAMVGVLKRNIPGTWQSWAEDCAAVGVAMTYEEAPVKTGALRESIESNVGKFFVEINVKAPHALYVEMGTRPHVILGNPVLSWLSPDGTRVWSKRVVHPGTQPNPFLFRAHAKWREYCLDLLREVFQKTFAEAKSG